MACKVKISAICLFAAIPQGREKVHTFDVSNLKQNISFGNLDTQEVWFGKARISEIIKGKRRIMADTALRLS